MSKVTINNGDSGGAARAAINANFTELYDAVSGLGGSPGDDITLSVGSFISDTGDDDTSQITWRAKTNEAGAGDFLGSLNKYAGSNGETRHDNVLSYGYNNGPTGRIVNTEHAFFFNIESRYKTAEGINQLEFYYAYVSAAGLDFRPFGITCHLDDNVIVVNTVADSVAFMTKDGTGNAYANFTESGPTFWGTNAFFNDSADNAERAQFSFDELTGQHTYTFPDASGEIPLLNANGALQLPGGAIVGSNGPSAYFLTGGGVKIAGGFVDGVTDTGTGTYADFNGASAYLIGRTNDPTLVIIPSSGQTALQVQFSNAGHGTVGGVSPAGKVYGTALAIGAAGPFDDVISLIGTPTANRSVTVPDANGTLLVSGAHSSITSETVTGYVTMKDSSGTDRKFAIVS
jgi:hypothetical protein